MVHLAASLSGFSIEAIADDVAAVAEELGLREALYIGHSLGGFLGLLTEVRHPCTFSAMCLVASGAARGGSVSDLFVCHGGDEGHLLSALQGNYDNPAHVHGHVEAALLIDPHVHEVFFEQFPKIDLLSEIAHVRIPTLMLNGGRDAIVSVARQHETALALPNCKEITFSSLGHNLPCDAPDLVVREVVAFWRNDVGRILSHA